MKALALLALMACTACSGSINWDTHGVKVDPDDKAKAAHAHF